MLDTLWMGAPVVSLRGKTAVGRGGASILSNIGLPELIADTLDNYAKIAVNLATDHQRRVELRDVRPACQRMSASPLMGACQFALDIEGSYIQLWKQFCTG